MEVEADSRSGLSGRNRPGGVNKVFVVGGVAALVLVVGGICVASVQGQNGHSGGGGHLVNGCNEEQQGFGCSSCVGEFNCTGCKENYNTFERGHVGNKTIMSCTFPCTVDQQLSGCTRCKNDQYCETCGDKHRQVDGECLFDCTEDQITAGCKLCKNAKMCKTCESSDLQLVDVNGEKTCVKDCHDEQVRDNCIKCDQANRCLTCKPGLGPWKGHCVDECLSKGETDIADPLNMAPMVRNEFEFQRMCVDDDVAHFFVVGDWGGAYSVDHWGHGYLGRNNQHTGDVDGAAADSTGANHKYYSDIDAHAQKLVSNQMEQKAPERKPRFVVNVGDSFYWGGFEELGCGGDPKKGWDAPRWKDVFESKYNIHHPTQPEHKIPFMGILGNHDYGGNHFDSGWDHQIYYTYKEDGGKASRWRMPGQWWKQSVHFKRFSLDLFFLDGNYADAKSIGQDPSHNICGKIDSTQDGKCHGAGLPEGQAQSGDGERHWKTEQAAMDHQGCRAWHWKNWDRQMEWLGGKIAVSKAHYTAIVTHYPGNCEDAKLKGIIDAWGVDLCITGHSHFQVIGQQAYGNQCNAANPCKAPLKIISGGGGGITSESSASDDNNQYGYFDLQLTESELTAWSYNQAGKESQPMWKLPRRSKRALGEEEEAVV